MTVRFAAIGDVAMLNPKQPELNTDAGAIVPFLPMSAVREGGGPPTEANRRFEDVSSGYTYFEKGDVLLAKITPCFENGKVAYLDALSHPFGFGSTEFHVLRTGPELDASYLYHAIRDPHFKRAGASNMTGSAGQQRVPAAFVARYQIPLPPLSEQRRIATLLTKTDTTRLKRIESLQLLEDLYTSIAQGVFRPA